VHEHVVLVHQREFVSRAGGRPVERIGLARFFSLAFLVAYRVLTAEHGVLGALDRQS